MNEARRQEQLLAALLRDLRNAAGLRQADLAERLGRPQSFVSKYESGERRLDVVDLLAVCQALGMKPSALMKRFEEQLS